MFVACTEKYLSSVNETRLEIFVQKFKLKSVDDALACVKRFDGSSFPPCARVLYEKICSTKYIAKLWLSSASRNPPAQLPEVLGWKIEDDKYTVKWFEGEVSPKLIDLEMTSSEDKLEQHEEG